jgi:hypothetical protein
MLASIFSGRSVLLREGRWLMGSWLVSTAGAVETKRLLKDQRAPETGPVAVRKRFHPSSLGLPFFGHLCANS